MEKSDSLVRLGRIATQDLLRSPIREFWYFNEQILDALTKSPIRVFLPIVIINLKPRDVID